MYLLQRPVSGGESPDDSAVTHLERLADLLENYFHPSNNGACVPRACRLSHFTLVCCSRDYIWFWWRLMDIRELFTPCEGSECTRMAKVVSGSHTPCNCVPGGTSPCRLC